jgi:hypothetical protein
MFTKNPQAHEYTIVAFPQKSITKGIESKEGMAGSTSATIFTMSIDK